MKLEFSLSPHLGKGLCIFLQLTNFFPLSLCSSLRAGPIEQLVQDGQRNGREHRFQLQGQASLFSEKNSSERNALILKADECITRSILTTAPLEDHNRIVHRKPEFMLGDATLDTDQ